MADVATVLSPKDEQLAAQVAKARSGDVDAALRLLIISAGYMERREVLPTPVADYIAACFRSIDAAATPKAFQQTPYRAALARDAKQLRAWCAEYHLRPSFDSIALAAATGLNLRPPDQLKHSLTARFTEQLPSPAEVVEQHVGLAVERERERRRRIPAKERQAEDLTDEAVGEWCGLSGREVRRLHGAWIERLSAEDLSAIRRHLADSEDMASHEPMS